MFKTIQIIVMAALCLNFNSRAQSPKTLPLPNKQAILGKVISSTTAEALPGAVIKTANPVDVFKSININGKIMNENGRPLSGATIKVKGTSRETKTNSKGEFYLENVAENAVIEISYIGYVMQEVIAKTNITLTMQPNTNALQEVSINKGYYNTTKELNTGSVSTVTAASLARQPVSDPLLALHGQVPGLYIAQQTGTQGTPATVRIRGTNSIANGNDPLYIVDGVPFSSDVATRINVTGAGISISPFSVLGMENIESIDVLKDADATAIYGSRGANGVILITTKKGKAGKTTLNANFNRGFGRIVNGYNLMNTEQYLQMRREAFANDGRVPIATSYDVNGTWDQNSYTDWEEVMIGGTAQLTNASASLSGGNELTQFLLAGNYRKETTVFPGNYRDRKISVQSNVTNRSANNRLNTSFNFNYTTDNNLLPTQDYTDFIVLAPNSPALYNTDGTLNWANSTWYNPFAGLYNKSTSEVVNLIGGLNLSYTILKGLKVLGRLGYNEVLGKTLNLLPAIAKDPENAITPNSRRHTVGNKRTTAWIMEPALNYNTSFNWLKLESTIGATFQESSYNGLTMSGIGFNSDAIMEDLQAAATLTTSGSVYGIYRYNAVYGRVGLTTKDRYVLNLTGRRDGSSRFGPGNQFGNFGAIGAAWLFYKEQLIIKNIKWLSFGKIRASYGITGNDQLTDYQYLSTYSSTAVNYQGIGGLNPTQHTNPDYAWETVNKLEAALDLGFLNNDINLNISWYRNRTSNQLVGYPLPAYTGFPSVQANLPAIVQNAGLELELVTNLISKKELTWSVSANFSRPTNKLVSYPRLEASSYSNRFVIGMPITIVQRYHYTGLNSQTGLFTFHDRNGDGNITSAVDRYPIFVGQKYFGGVSNSFTYKGIELSILLQYVKQSGHKTGPLTSPGFFYTSQGNIPSSYVNRFQNPGDVTKFQKVTQVSGSPAAASYNLFRDSDGLIVDKSFLRLRNASLSYSMPKAWINRIGITNLKLFVQGQNLFTITKFDGADPEMTSQNYSLPPLRMICSGVQASL